MAENKSDTGDYVCYATAMGLTQKKLWHNLWREFSDLCNTPYPKTQVTLPFNFKVLIQILLLPTEIGRFISCNHKEPETYL